MIVTETSSSTFEPCPAGSYLASLRRLIDMGTQKTEYQGEAKTARKVLLVWEIVDPETHLEDGRPYTVAKRYTLSLNEKASLRKDLASWRGRDFTPDELRGFDLASVLGKSCMLSIVHADKGDRTYANIAAVMKAPRGLQGSEPTEPLVHFDLAAPDWQVFAGLPQRLQDQIAQSPEFQVAKQLKSAGLKAAGGAPGAGFDDMDDDIPW